MKKLVILLVLSFLFWKNEITTFAQEQSTPIRDLIYWFDHWVRKDWTLEKHIRNECEAHEASKVPLGDKWLKHFKIISSRQIGNTFFVAATYQVKDFKCEVTAKVIHRNGIWINQEFTFDYHK